MGISIFLIVGMLQLLETLNTVSNVKMLVFQKAIFEKKIQHPSLLILIHIFIKISVSFSLPKCFMVHLPSEYIAIDHS